MALETGNASTGGTRHGPLVHEGTRENFAALVLENSSRGPVLVNFWTAKAGPCLRLYPVLDKLVHAYGGRFLLVNVDADAERQVARDYDVISVPCLKLFHNGAVVETLRGYQSEADLRRVLDRHVVRESDLRVGEALRHYAEGDAEQAFIVLAQAAMDDPANLRVPEVMAKLLVREDRAAEARALLSTLPEAARREAAIAALLAHLSELEGPERPAQASE